MTKGGLGALDQSLADIGDSEGGLVGTDDVVVDDRGKMEGDIVLGHADLLGHLDDLDLDVDLDQALREGVNLDQARVDGLIELAKLGDESDISLVYVLVRIRADDAAWEGAQGTDTSAERVDYLLEGVYVSIRSHSSIHDYGRGLATYSCSRTSPWGSHRFQQCWHSSAGDPPRAGGQQSC